MSWDHPGSDVSQRYVELKKFYFIYRYLFNSCLRVVDNYLFHIAIIHDPAIASVGSLC